MFLGGALRIREEEGRRMQERGNCPIRETKVVSEIYLTDSFNAADSQARE